MSTIDRVLRDGLVPDVNPDDFRYYIRRMDAVFLNPEAPTQQRQMTPQLFDGLFGGRR